MKSNYVVLDFDGTCVTHEFPKIGKDIGAVPVLRKLVENGHKLILFTMRSDVESPTSSDPDIHCQGGKYLTEAVEWFQKNNVPLYGIQTNPDQTSWTHSPKAYGQLIIDDAAIGVPLVYGMHERPYVDWKQVEALLVREGYIKDSLKVIIAGSRNFIDFDAVEARMMDLLRKGELGSYQKIEIVSGCATGADSLGVDFANKYKLKLHRFPAKWDLHGKAAGPIRNWQMAQFADMLVAFHDGKSPGTKNMIEEMNKLGKPVALFRISI